MLKVLFTVSIKETQVRLFMNFGSRNARQRSRDQSLPFNIDSPQHGLKDGNLKKTHKDRNRVWESQNVGDKRRGVKSMIPFR